MSSNTPAPAGGVFPSSNHFPVRRRYGQVEATPEPPSRMRPFGLTLAVLPKSVSTVNPAEIGYDEETQLGWVRREGGIVPLSRHTDGPTNTVTDGPDGHGSNRDSDSDHRED